MKWKKTMTHAKELTVGVRGGETVEVHVHTSDYVDVHE